MGIQEKRRTGVAMDSNGIRTARKKLYIIMGRIEMAEASSRPLSSAYTAAESSRMWLGECLQESGQATPYKDSLDPSNENIADQADVPGDLEVAGYDSHIKEVKELRALLVELAEKMRQEIITGSRKQFYQLAMSQAYVESCNARMWLGAELNRIHEEASA